MKAISLWQPWASMMQMGAKRNETRSWATGHRGDLAICSSKRKPSREEVGDDLIYMEAMTFPYGFVLCVVELCEMIPTEHFHGATPLKISRGEAELGNYEPGRFAWVTKNLRVLKEPVPVIGRQGIWKLPPETEALVRAQLP